MKKRTVESLFLILIIFHSCRVEKQISIKEPPAKSKPEISNELRGIWVTSSDWTGKDLHTMRNNIKDCFKEIAEANFNAVFFQVRNQSGALYPTFLEPWSSLIGSEDPGFDPVQIAVEEAHRNGLMFYPWVDFLPLWDEEKPPADTTHLFYSHGPNVSNDSSWICFRKINQPGKADKNYYLNPALPEVKSYLKRVIRHLARNYDIDGIHFDRAWYPGPDYTFGHWSDHQFMTDSLHSPQSRIEWAGHKLTDLVEDVVAEALLLKPYLIISAATPGFYRTHDTPDSTHFMPGSNYYCQDAMEWLDRGIMDFIIPLINRDSKDSIPDVKEIWTYVRNVTPLYKHVFPGIEAGSNRMPDDEMTNQVDFLRQNGAVGHVMFHYSSIQGKDPEIIKKNIYPARMEIPVDLKRNAPDQIFVFNMSDLLPASSIGQNIYAHPSEELHTTDNDGILSVIYPERTDTLILMYNGESDTLDTRWWAPPFNFRIQPDGMIKRDAPWVEARKILPRSTNVPEIWPLFKTNYPGMAIINGNPAGIYQTGIFFDKIGLSHGPNRIRATVFSGDSVSTFYEQEVVFSSKKNRDAFPLWIDERSIEPNEEFILLRDDIIPFRFTGSKGQKALVKIQPDNIEIQFSRTDYSDFSRYQAEIPFRLLRTNIKYTLSLFLEPVGDTTLTTIFELPAKASFMVKERDEFPLVRTIRPNSALTYNLGQIRLGGPIIAEYDTGVILTTDGQIGDHYRVRLNRNEQGFIHKDLVEKMAEQTIKPEYYLQLINCSPAPNADVVRIQYPEPVPYAIFPDPEQKRISISLYGVKTSSTWIVHGNNLRLIDKIGWNQVDPETYQVIINLKTSRIWGYDIERKGSSLVFRVKDAPTGTSGNRKKSVEGLKIAIEAGHGGRNVGAVGLSGIFEKDINLDVSQRLAEICRRNGMEVLQIRESDRDMSLDLKRDTVENSDAHLLVSIHANAGGTQSGYLGADGVSTYYHNPFWEPFAASVYDRVLELGLDEFGMVGSFNYRVIRMSSRPAILVEQAFLSHAEDEEKLASEDFRQQMAQKIFDGIKEYIRIMLE